MLNAEKIFSLVYKSVNMTDLLWCLGTVEQNRLIIGKHIMWLVVARTGHKTTLSAPRGGSARKQVEGTR